MWTVHISCPSCKHRAPLPHDALLLTLSPNEESARYSWICVKCRQSQVREADAAEIAILRQAHVPEKRANPTGPPFTSDDVIDLMLELESGAWL